MIEQQEWRQEARCKGVDTAVFFPNFKVEADWKATAAKVCKGCPVKADCLEWAVTHDESGLWAGTTTKERALMRKERGLRRPMISQIDVQPCGTEAAYQRHRRSGEPACESCIRAHRLRVAESKELREPAFVDCLFCGENFKQRSNRLDASRFCSDTCGTKYRRIQKRAVEG